MVDITNLFAKANPLSNVFNTVASGLTARINPGTGNVNDTAPQQLRFPLENVQDYGGYITFTAKQKTPKPLGAFADSLVTDISKGAGGFDLLGIKKDNNSDNYNTDNKEVDVKPIQPTPKQIQDAKRDDRPPLPEYIGKGRTCRLYLPNALQFQDTVSYTNIDLGILGNAIEQGLQSNQTGMQMLSNAYGTITESFEALPELLRKGAQTEAAQIALLRLSRRVSSEVSGAVSTTTGIAVNPNRRSMLQGPNLRSFRFTFKMIPTSPDEARSVKSIIQFFREEMYPEQTNNFGVSAALRYPSEFHIKLLYKTNLGKVKNVATGILPCHLSAVDVNYNPTGMSFHTDGEVQETDLSLQFTEVRTLTKREVATGGY